MNLKPLGARILVRPIEKEKLTKGGIVVPDTAKEKPQQGKVMAVGTGRILENGNRVALEVKEGDTVLYSKYGGTEVKVDDEDMLILAEQDILAVVN